MSTFDVTTIPPATPAVTNLMLERSALQIASSIVLPKQLPNGHRGYPLKHLSLSAINTWQMCRETYKRRYFLGEKSAPSSAMFVGSRVDDTVGKFFEAQMGGTTLSLPELKEVMKDNWKVNLEQEDAKLGVDWEEDEKAAHAMALKAVEITYNELIPKIGRGTASQRKFSFKLAADCAWSIIGFVDLDTIRPQRVFLRGDGELLAIQDTGQDEPTVCLPYNEAPSDLRPQLLDGEDVPISYADALELVARTTEARAIAEAAGKSRKPKIYEIPDVQVPLSRLAGQIVDREVEGVVDYKVKNAPIAQYKADSDPQATLYLAERAIIAGQPQHDFRFAQVAKPVEGKRQSMSTALVSTTRTHSQMMGILTRFAQAAAEIVWFHENVSLEAPWGFAEPGHWKCQPHPEKAGVGRFCSAWTSCPMGAGL